MGIIIRAAYLSLCKKCNRHATIMCDGEEICQHFVTKAQGYDTVAQLQRDGKISSEERGLIRDEIETCSLPENRPDLEVIIPIILSSFNETETFDVPPSHTLH
jgi:hypothetical protein